MLREIDFFKNLLIDSLFISRLESGDLKNV